MTAEVMPDWLTLDEAAAYLKVSKPTVYRYCEQGALRFYKMAGTGYRRFIKEDLDALMEPGKPGDAPTTKEAKK